MRAAIIFAVVRRNDLLHRRVSLAQPSQPARSAEARNISPTKKPTKSATPTPPTLA